MNGHPWWQHQIVAKRTADGPVMPPGSLSRHVAGVCIFIGEVVRDVRGCVVVLIYRRRVFSCQCRDRDVYQINDRARCRGAGLIVCNCHAVYFIRDGIDAHDGLLLLYRIGWFIVIRTLNCSHTQRTPSPELDGSHANWAFKLGLTEYTFHLSSVGLGKTQSILECLSSNSLLFV